MEYNKVYFHLYYLNIPPNQIITPNVGLEVRQFNFRQLLGNLYYKYNAFSIKLESYVSRTASTADPLLDNHLFHIAGLNFINGYDSSTMYNYSRVLEVIDFSLAFGTMINFISNCNSTMFYKPTSDTLDLTFFFTRISDEVLTPYPDDVNFIFSITGIDSYKVQNPERPLTIIRPANTKNINFSLQSNKGQILDSRNRAYRFSNINLRNLIGQEYDKYSKFCLITKYINISTNAGTGFAQAFSGFNFYNLTLSGLNFCSVSRAQYFTSTDPQALASIHPTTTANIAFGIFNITRPLESYIENAFYKGSEIVDITISYNQIYQFNLVNANAGTTDLFPQFTVNFDIVPLLD